MKIKDDLCVGRIKEICRYPVKSILGESLSWVTLDRRGLVGDRLWAIKDKNGKFGSGKTTRRFQQMEGLFNFQARYEGSIPMVTMPDGVVYRGDDKVLNAELSRWIGLQVALSRENTISHFDEGPVSIITTSSLRILSDQLGQPVDACRFRANLLIDTPLLDGYIEDEWTNRLIQIGPAVTLRIVAPLQRCVMVNTAQKELPEDTRILRTLSKYHDGTFGVWAKVEIGGDVTVGDQTVLL